MAAARFKGYKRVFNALVLNGPRAFFCLLLVIKPLVQAFFGVHASAGPWNSYRR